MRSARAMIILAAAVLADGCAYHQAMTEEKSNRERMTREYEYSQKEKIRLTDEQAALQQKRAALKKDIENDRRKLAALTSTPPAQRLPDWEKQIRESEERVARKKAELERLSD